MTLDGLLQKLVAEASVSGQEGPLAGQVQALLEERGIPRHGRP